jgi:hypothetical protein
VRPPEKGGGRVSLPAPHRDRQYKRAEFYREPVTDNATAFGAMLTRPLTTTRTCNGAYCWCRFGPSIAWPLDHYDEMARMARDLRGIEIGGGVLGA